MGCIVKWIEEDYIVYGLRVLYHHFRAVLTLVTVLYCLMFMLMLKSVGGEVERESSEWSTRGSGHCNS